MKAKVLLLSLMTAATVMLTARPAWANPFQCRTVTGTTAHTCSCQGVDTFSIRWYELEYNFNCGTKTIFTETVFCPGVGGDTCYVGSTLSRNCTNGECINNW